MHPSPQCLHHCSVGASTTHTELCIPISPSPSQEEALLVLPPPPDLPPGIPPPGGAGGATRVHTNGRHLQAAGVCVGGYRESGFRV